jgi:thioredoxin 1
MPVSLSSTFILFLISSQLFLCAFRMIKPHFHRLAEENPNVIFLSVDVDALDDLASQCGINAMPTFQFYKNNVKQFEFQGASLDGLKSALAQHQ